MHFVGRIWKVLWSSHTLQYLRCDVDNSSIRLAHDTTPPLFPKGTSYTEDDTGIDMFTTVRYVTVTTQHGVSSGAQSQTYRHRCTICITDGEVSRTLECCVTMCNYVEIV
jgi:hypothetical protein